MKLLYYNVRFINKVSISSRDLCHITGFLVFIQPANWILLVRHLSVFEEILGKTFNECRTVKM
jgi:hypothetical protein